MLRTLRGLQRAGMAYVSRKPIDPLEYCLSPADGVVYVVNAKAGCTSIIAEILKRNGWPSNDNSKVDAHYLHDLVRNVGLVTRDRRKVANLFTFSLVRNPFSRLVSFFEDKFQKVQKCPYSVPFELKYYLGGIFQPTMSFEQVVRTVVRIPDQLAERHFKSQNYLLNVELGKRDYVGKLENVDSAVRELDRYIDLSRLKRINASKPKPISTYYDPELFELVYRRYRADLENFGYEQDVSKLANELCSTRRA